MEKHMMSFRDAMDQILDHVNKLPYPKRRYALERLCIGADRIAESNLTTTPELLRLALSLREAVFGIW
jgi:hypothetical protein